MRGEDGVTASGSVTVLLDISSVEARSSAVTVPVGMFEDLIVVGIP
jgi:hypothetical protein